jgi:hypothetical protein
MQRTTLSALVLIALLTGGGFAQAPVSSASLYAIGLQYTAFGRGQLITNAHVGTHEIVHQLRLTYAPIEFVQLTAGASLGNFSTDTVKGKKFNGSYGIGPAASLSLYSPAFLNGYLRVFAGGDVSFINSADELGYRYQGPVAGPFFGCIVHVSRYVDIEAGARGHFIDGAMKDPQGVTAPFSNGNIVRGRGAVTIMAPRSAFLRLTGEASPAAAPNWEKGPFEALVGVEAGVTLSTNSADRRIEQRTKKYFPDFERLKKRQQEMQEALE